MSGVDVASNQYEKPPRHKRGQVSRQVCAQVMKRPLDLHTQFMGSLNSAVAMLALQQQAALHNIRHLPSISFCDQMQALRKTSDIPACGHFAFA